MGRSPGDAPGHALVALGHALAAPSLPAGGRAGREGRRKAQRALCVRSVHGQRGRLRPGLRRAVWRAAEGVPGPHIHHQLHPGRSLRLAQGRCPWEGRCPAQIHPCRRPRPPAYRLASDARPCTRRCTARCSTPPRTTAPCASGTCAGSEVPRGPLRPRAASHASSATRWAAPPRPCSRPDPAGGPADASPDAHRLPERPALLPAAVAPDGRGGARKPGREESPAQASGFSLVARRRWERECSPSGPPSFPF